MPIHFSEKDKTFKLDTNNSSYIIAVYEENYLLNLYYGAFIPDSFVPNRAMRTPNASFSPANPVIGEHGFSPDTAPIEYGTSGAGDFRIAALEIENSNGDSVTDIRYTGYKIYDGKKEIPKMPSSYVNSDSEAQTLEIYAEDSVTGAQVTLYYTVFQKYDVITRRVRVTNGSMKKMRLERAMSLCLDLPDMDYDLISLYGCHAKERNIERRPLAHGIQGVESRRGSSSHNQNPFIALAKSGADEYRGEARGHDEVVARDGDPHHRAAADERLFLAVVLIAAAFDQWFYRSADADAEVLRFLDAVSDHGEVALAHRVGIAASLIEAHHRRHGDVEDALLPRKGAGRDLDSRHVLYEADFPALGVIVAARLYFHALLFPEEFPVHGDEGGVFLLDAKIDVLGAKRLLKKAEPLDELGAVVGHEELVDREGRLAFDAIYHKIGHVVVALKLHMGRERGPAKSDERIFLADGDDLLRRKGEDFLVAALMVGRLALVLEVVLELQEIEFLSVAVTVLFKPEESPAAGGKHVLLEVATVAKPDLLVKENPVPLLDQELVLPAASVGARDEHEFRGGNCLDRVFLVVNRVDGNPSCLAYHSRKNFTDTKAVFKPPKAHLKR